LPTYSNQLGEVAIEVTGLGKRYSMDGRGPRRAHEVIEQTVRGLFRNSPPREPADFWAVRDCTFTVRQGEVVALLGRNGAGKSVLLKMLSRVIKPTTGEAVLRGRITGLLELGSGFHPEMTGRENVFFNGAILGMRRVEMEKKLDEIVAFSEVGEFLDMPVKHYSSGMYMRLAFSIAAHVETDILLLDEVLAVGDSAFQEKCLDRMRLATRQGTTILIVSHEVTLLAELCSRGLYLDHGRLAIDGSLAEVTERYRQETTA
jgi:lipopolysaccharide transport system ATP-binding protein